MLYTETAARDNVRNRDGKRVFYLGPKDQLTSGARDYLSRERIEILPAEQAKREAYKLLGGGYLDEKPEHMTHLNAEFLVPKTHPRIAFRGEMDSLEGEILACGLWEKPELKKGLEEILTLARTVLRCDVLEEPLKEEKLLGLTQEELRSHSHRPQDFYGQPHFMPRNTDSQEILKLNRLRTMARRAELTAVRAFTDETGRVERMDILRAMNRMSSAFYLLMIQEKAGEKKQ